MNLLTPLALLLSSSALAAQGGSWSMHDDIYGTYGGSLGACVLAPAGDVNGDGFADILAGAHSASPNGEYLGGSAYIYSGLTGAELWRFDGKEEDFLGYAVDSAGDINFDGYDDVIIAAPYRNTYRGRVRIRSGADGTVLHKFKGESPGEYLGSAVLGTGDHNGDGIPEIMVGVPGVFDGWLQTGGEIRVYSGADGSLWKTLLPPDRGTGFGAKMAHCGDVDQDGIDDFMAVCRRHSNQLILVYSGRSLREIMRIRTDASTWGPLRSMGNAGDMNRDGVDDIVVGAPYVPHHGTSSVGAVFLYSGADGSLIQRVDGSRGHGYFGFATLGNVDLNHDGYSDIIITSPTDKQSRIWVYSGKDGSVMTTLHSLEPGDMLGLSITEVGDTDGDGYQEIAIAAPGSNALGIPNAGAIYLADFD